MLRIMTLKKNVVAARKEREKEKSRLKAAREPIKASSDLLDKHPNDPLVLIKFREMETLRERSLLVPVGVSLSELKQQACTFFNYPPAKFNGVKLGYPNDGIERYDAEGDSMLRNLDSDSTLQEAFKHWNSGVSTRRDSSLVHYTLHSAYNIVNPTRQSEVMVGARLLFEMTVVPTNIHSLERLGQLEPLEKSPGALLSSIVDTHVAAGAHLHWHLSFDSLLYRRRRCVSRKDVSLAREAEAALSLALEGEAAALSLSKYGNKANTEKAIQIAKKHQRVAEAKAHRSIINPPTMLKLMRILSVVCAMRRHRLGPPSRLRPDAIEAEIEELYDPEERIQREASARKIQQIARTRKAKQEVEKRRRMQAGGSDAMSVGESASSINFGEDDASISSYGSGRYTLSTSSASWFLEAAYEDEDEDNTDGSRIHMWNANQYTKGFKLWLQSARTTIATWNAMVDAEPSSLDLLLYFTLGSLWMNIRDPLTRKIHAVHISKNLLELATTPVPLTKAERSALAKQAKLNQKTSGAAAAFGSAPKASSPLSKPGESGGGGEAAASGETTATVNQDDRSNSPPRPKSPDASSIAPEFGGVEQPNVTIEKDAVNDELEVLIGYQKRLQGMSMHFLCYLVKISEPVRIALARHHHILCLISHTFSIRTVEPRAVQMAAITVLARLVQQQQHRELFTRKDLSGALWDIVLLGMKLNLHPQISQQHNDESTASTSPSPVNTTKKGDAQPPTPRTTRKKRLGPLEQKRLNENLEIEHGMLMAMWGICHALEQMSDIPPKIYSHHHHHRKHKGKHGKHGKHKHHQPPSSSRVSSNSTVASNTTQNTNKTQTTHQAALQTTLVHPAISVAQSIQQSTEIIPTVLKTMLSETQPPQAAASATKALFSRDSSQRTLLDNLSAICGWTRDFGYSPATQRCSISILTVCAAAAPGLVALKLGVPGLTRLLMFAAGSDNMSNSSVKNELDKNGDDDNSVDYDIKLTAENHLEQHNVMHNLRVQEGAVATLGHLSKAAGNAAKRYKPKKTNRNIGEMNTVHHHGHHKHGHHKHGHKHEGGGGGGGGGGGSLSSKLKSAGFGKAASPGGNKKKSGGGAFGGGFGNIAVGVAKAAEDEKSLEEKLVGIFRRFVDEAGGVEKLSNLRKSWESKAKLLFNELDKHFPKCATSPKSVNIIDPSNDFATASVSSNGSQPHHTQPSQPQTKDDDSTSSSTKNNTGGGGGASSSTSTNSKKKGISSVGSKDSTHIGGGRYAPDLKSKHRGITLELKLKAFRGMLQSTSLIIVNLSSLPAIEDEEPTSPKTPSKSNGNGNDKNNNVIMGTNGKPLPQRTARGKALLKKLQGAVSPRDRVKKVIEMLWSDKRSIAEQGCAALWLLARDKGPRAVVVDLCLQSGVFGGVLPIVPRLHALITATPNLGLRTWSLSAIWMLCEDERFRNQPGPFIIQELVPLLIRHIVEYAPIFIPSDEFDEFDLKSRKSNGTPLSPQSSKRELLFGDDSDDEDGGKDNNSNGGAHTLYSDDDSDDYSDDYSDDDNENMKNGGLGAINEDDEDELEIGMDHYESIAAKWKASDLKHHCERQRLAGVSLGCLLQLTHFHPQTKALLQRDPMNSGLEAALIGLLERKATIGGLKRSAYHLLFLICATHPASMARLLQTVNDILPHANEINDHDHDMEVLLREHNMNVSNNSSGAATGVGSTPMGMNGKTGNMPDVKINVTSDNTNVGGSNVGGASFLHGSLTEGSNLAGGGGVGGPKQISPCLYLEHAALALLNVPYESKKQAAAAAVSVFKTVQTPKKNEKGGVGGGGIKVKTTAQQQLDLDDPAIAKEEQRKCAMAGCAALAAAEALVLGQFQGPPPQVQDDQSVRKGGEDKQHDAAKGDGTADEDDAALCFAMAALVDLAARRDISKSAIVARGGAKLAARYFKSRPSAASLSKAEMLAIITSHSNAVVNGRGIASQAVGNGGGSEDSRMILGVWKRIYPLHLLLNVSSLDVCRLKTCIASFEDLIIATRGPRLAKKINRLSMKKLRKEFKENKGKPLSSAASVGGSTIATNDIGHKHTTTAAAQASSPLSSPPHSRPGSPGSPGSESGGDSTDDDDYSSSSDEEDGAEAWGRQLAFGCLANLSRNIEARQRIFRYAIGIGLMPPGVRKRGVVNKANIMNENNCRSGWGAGGGLALQRKSSRRKPSTSHGPPPSIYLGETMANALDTLKLNKEGGGSGNGDLQKRPATTGGDGNRKRPSELGELKPGAHISTGKLLTQWNKESRLKANSNNPSIKHKKKKEKEKLRKKKEAQELKLAIDEAKELKQEDSTLLNDDDNSTIASDNIAGLPPKSTQWMNKTSSSNQYRNSSKNMDNVSKQSKNTNAKELDDYTVESFSMSTIDAAETESEHLSNVMAWMFSSDQFPKPKGAPRRIAVKVPDQIPEDLTEDPDNFKRPTSSGGGGYKSPKHASAAAAGNKKNIVQLGSLNKVVGSMSDHGTGGLAAARRRRSDGNLIELEEEDPGMLETIEVYPSGADAWHPTIAAAALKSNNHPPPGSSSSSASVTSTLASSFNETKRKKALIAANGGSFDALSKNSNIQQVTGGGTTTVNKPRKLIGAEKAVDPRHTRKAVAVVLSPRVSDGNRFMWGQEKPEFEVAGANTGGFNPNQTFGHSTTLMDGTSTLDIGTTNRSVNFGGNSGTMGGTGTSGGGTGGGGGDDGHSTLYGPNSTTRPMSMTSTIPSAHEIRTNVLNAALQMSQGDGSISNITGGHTVPAPPQLASSGRIWMWPHVEGSKVGYGAGLVPFRVQGPPDVSLTGVSGPNDGCSQSYANSISADGQPNSSHGFHFYHRPSASALPFPAPPLPRPLPPTDLGRIFQMTLPTGAPPLVPAPDMGGEGDPLPLGAWALLLDYGHQLDWTRPPPWILPVAEKSELTPVQVGDRQVDGGIPLSPAFFLAQAPPKDIPIRKEVPVKKEHIPSHRMPTSVWVDRPTMNDGKDFMDSPALYKKALNRDWRRLLNEDRFFKFVDREDDHAANEGVRETVEDEMDEVKEVLFDWAAPLLRIFDYYCLLGSAATNTNDNGAFAVSENSYHSLCNDLQFVDKRKCTKAYLSNVFVQVNVEVDDGKKDDKTAAAQNFVNEDRALMRFEFLEALVRIAVNKYKADVGGDVSEALQMLFENHIGPFFIDRGLKLTLNSDEFFDNDLMETSSVGSVAIFQDDQVELRRTKPIKKYEATGKSSQNLFVDPNTWRAASLYNNKVDDTLKSHQRALELIYTGYSRYETVTRGGITQKSKTAAFSLQSWMDFLDDAKLIQTAKNQNPWGQVLSQREARLVFFLSRFNVVDEVKHRSRCTSLDVLEFFEALCRYVLLKRYY